MRKSGPGAKHPVHETVTTCVISDAGIPASSRAACAAWRDSSGACRMYSALRSAVPGERSIALGVDEDPVASGFPEFGQHGVAPIDLGGVERGADQTLREPVAVRAAGRRSRGCDPA